MKIDSPYCDTLATPIGALHIGATERGVSHVIFCDQPISPKPNHFTQDAKAQLSEYFAGRRKEFDLAMDAGGTDFQQKVWQALIDIPFGLTSSYSDLAHSIDNPKAVRAVGGANGRNPISIIVPCHRVIGANKNLTGYAWGLERKQWLLKHEGAF